MGVVSVVGFGTWVGCDDKAFVRDVGDGGRCRGHYFASNESIEGWMLWMRSKRSSWSGETCALCAILGHFARVVRSYFNHILGTS